MEAGDCKPPVMSDRARVRTWIQKLNTSDLLAFSGQDELKMLLDLYDGNPLHPIQYHFDNRFKGRLPLSDPSLCSMALENISSNRTQENFPTDEGLLKTKDGRFFNASTIEGKDRTYIATQHPLPSTVLDFWQMVLAEKPDVVIMLNKHEYDQVKRYPNEPELVQYWPGTAKSGFVDTILLEDNESGGTVKISVLPEPVEHDIVELENGPTTSPNSAKKVRRNSNEPVPGLDLSQPNNTNNVNNNGADNLDTNNNNSNNSNQSNNDNVNITPIDPDTSTVHTDTEYGREHISNNGYREYKLNPQIEYSRLHVEYNGAHHQFWHIRCGGWKDQDAPDLDLFTDLWNLVQEKLKTHKTGEKHKLVIHCTGGVGRTGTFIAVDIAGQELKEKQKSGKWEEFSIEKVISFLRKKRMNMVGSVSQYIFCHRAALNLFAPPPPTPPSPPTKEKE